MLQRILLLVSVVSVLSLHTDAQAFQWAKQLSAHYSVGTEIVTDNNLNVISSGWFNDSVDLDPGPNVHWVYEQSGTTSYNSYLSKLDANGWFVWGYSYDDMDTGSHTRILSLDVDNQDNILVMGQYRDSMDLDFGSGVFKLYGNNNNSNTYWDNLFIAKYDPSGALIWGKGLQSSSTSTAYGLWGNGLKVDGSNNVIISGRFFDTVDFDPGPGVYNLVSTNFNTSFYNGNRFLLKLTSAGNFTWVRDWNNTGGWNNSGWYSSDELDVDQNDNIFFPLIFRDSLDTNPLAPVNMVYSQGLSDIALFKISPSGNVVWHKELGGPNQDYCNSLATDPSGNIFYSVRPGSNPIDMDPGPGSYMIGWNNATWGKVILKLDNNGNFIWALKNMDNNSVSSWFGEGIATDTSGALYLTTRIFANSINNNQWDLDPGIGAFIVNSAGSNDIAFQNLDGNGQFIWGGVMGGAGNEWAYDICTDNARGVYLTGFFNNKADFDPTPDTSFMNHTPGSYDAFIVKLNNCNKVTSQVYQSCDSVLFNSQYYYSDTIIQSHYPAWNGCDSAHSIVIDVQMLSYDTIQIDTCTFYVWNNNTYTSSGFYTHNYGLPGGCDSVVTIDLTIRYKSAETINIDLCDTTTINGVTYSIPGSYNQFLTNVAGCDSILTINLAPMAIDTSITQGGMSSLTSNAVGVTYQWIDCSTNLPIAGETNVFFNAQQSGSYACIITQNGCPDTTYCYNLTVAPDAVREHNLQSHLYPNPSKGSYHLLFDKLYQNVQLEVRTISGQLVWQKSYAELKETNITIDKSAGVYMLYIKQGNQKQVKKLLKW